MNKFVVTGLFTVAGLAAGYFLAEELYAGDDQPIVVAGGSFEIRTLPGHGFQNPPNTDNLVHHDPKRVLTGISDVTDTSGNAQGYSFSNAAAIQFAYCAVASACELDITKIPDDLVTLNTDNNRKNVAITGNGTTVTLWQHGNQKWSRMPDDGQHILAWIKVSDGGTLVRTYKCSAAVPCAFSLHHYCRNGNSPGCK